MTDSVDLVPIAAFYGKGKRTGVYGAYLLACYDEETDTYQSACKVGTGFSDTQLKELSTALNKHKLNSPLAYYRYSNTLKPDAWFEPAVVWEVLAADLSISPVHKAAVGLVDAVKGIALRFPRFIRVREDKGGEQATTAEQLQTMYLNQSTLS